jgi:pimeloyl-ACP methyl ester carboxylesterase
VKANGPGVLSNSVAVVLLACLLFPYPVHGEFGEVDRLIDVGGYRLHFKCSGEGGPTVILEAGLGGSAEGWVKVMPEVAKFTRVCAYDRPSEGKSDPAPRRLTRIGSRTYIELRNGADVVRDLHTLLSNAHEAGPYVMVGHSLGGLYVILFASAYPSSVAGMVLEDSSHPDQLTQKIQIFGAEATKHDHDNLMQNEEGADIDAIFAEVSSTHWSTSIPLFVLCRGSHAPPNDRLADQLDKAHVLQERDLASRSPDSKFLVAEKSGHFIHRDQPDLVVQAIRTVVDSARSRTTNSRKQD